MHNKFKQQMKCPSCMIRKSTLEDVPKLKDSATKPLYRVNMDSFSSSVRSLQPESLTAVGSEVGTWFWVRQALDEADQGTPSSSDS